MTPGPASLSGPDVAGGARSFALRLALAFLLTFAMVPLAALIFPETAFHRLFTRSLLLSLLAVFLPGAGSPRTWGVALRRLGWRGPDAGRRAAFGFAVAVALFAAVLLLSFALGGRPLRHPDPRWPGHLAVALLSAVGVGMLEETLWRGWLRLRLGALLSSLLYAAAHYFRPLSGSPPAPGPYNPLLAVQRFPEMLQSWSEPRYLTLGMAGLVLFGLALCRLRQTTGSLWLSAGVHAGFVFAIAMYRDFFLADTPASPWIFGGTRLYDGLLATLALALLLAASTRLARMMTAPDSGCVPRDSPA